MVLGLGLSSSAAVHAAESYAVDPVHSSITFMISHMDISYVHGRFNELSGTFTLDKDDPSRSSFALSIKVESVDTNNKKRDDHLRSPDFFNVKQFPTLSFESTAVKAVEGGYEVTGDLTMHGAKKSITFRLRGGKVVEFPKGMPRTGFWSELVLKRSDFGMTGAQGLLGDDVHIAIGIEGVRK
jgi:polyisoprenoid-binding protein YceI